MHTCAGKKRQCSSTIIRPTPKTFYSPNLAASGEQNNLEKSDYLEVLCIMAEIPQRQVRQWYVLEHTRDQSATEKDRDFRELDGEFYLNTCILPRRHEPCYSPGAFVAARTHCSAITSTGTGVGAQIEGQPVESDTTLTEAHRMFLSDDILSEDAQVYNLNDMFDNLQSILPPVTPAVQRTSPDLEGGSVAGVHFDALLPKPSTMKQKSGCGLAKKRKVTEAGDVTESRVFRRKYLVTERSEEADLTVPLRNTVPNSGSGEININTPRGIEVDGGEFKPQGMKLKPESSLENVIEFQSHYMMLKDLSIEVEAGFGSDHVQDEQHKYSKDVHDPSAVAGNYEDLYKPGDEVLLKTMGWFPVEECPNEDNDPNLSVRWILDEPPSASDLPHLENLLEISPSKFWSPESESRKRPPVRFGFLCCSESSQSSHSIQYFLNDSPASSPEVTRATLHCTSSVKISSTKPSYRCSPASPKLYSLAKNILTPMEASTKSPSLGSDRKLAAQVQEGAPESSLAFSTVNPKKSTSREQDVASSPVHHDHSHDQETGRAVNLTASESADRRLQHGKNLATDFLRVGTTQEMIEARLTRDDMQHTDITAQLGSTLRTQVENSALSSKKMRQKCSIGLSTKDRENSSLSLELQNLHGGDRNCSTQGGSPELRTNSSPLKLIQGQLRGDQNCTSHGNAPMVAFSDISNHPDSATKFTSALPEKLSSQLLLAKPVSKSLSNEDVATVRRPEVVPDNVAWSATGTLRVSRKRSMRITKPKLMGVEVSNRFGNGEVAQPIRATPNEDHCLCKRRKILSPKMNTFGELPTFSRKLRHLASTPTSYCETDPRKMLTQEATRPAKSPTLTRIVKPLRLIKHPSSKGNTYVKLEPILNSTVGEAVLATEPRNINPLRSVKNFPVKHPADVSPADLTSGKYPGIATRRREVKEESLSKVSVDCEIPAVRSSKYRGVTRHRHTGRYEAHLWDNSRMKLGLAKRGTQALCFSFVAGNWNSAWHGMLFNHAVYLGAYPDEDKAAEAHDLAALKYWGLDAYTNFPRSLYTEELKTMENLTKEEYVIILRRRSPGFTRGVSKYRGVTRHHQEGRWEARIGRHSGAKYHYLGTFDTQEEAAAAYDRAAVRHRGIKAITNFDISNYIHKNS